MLVVILAAVIWGTGAAMRTPRSARWIMIFLLVVAAIGVQLVFPEGHPLRAATGAALRCG